MPKGYPCQRCKGPTTRHCPDRPTPCDWVTCNTCDTIIRRIDHKTIPWPKKAG